MKARKKKSQEQQREKNQSNHKHAGKYFLGEKKAWRRQFWNSIKLFASPVSGILNRDVLYMPGPDNIEGPLIVSKGFRRNRLFCVERNENLVRLLRTNKANVIHDSIEQVVICWSAMDDYPSVTCMDLCCGIEQSIINCARWWILSAIALNQPRILACNILRGRDVRHIVSGSLEIIDSYKNTAKNVCCLGPDGALVKSELHRGCRLVDIILGQACLFLIGYGISKEVLRRQMLKSIDTRFFTYSSTAGSQKFDSFVLYFDPAWFYTILVTNSAMLRLALKEPVYRSKDGELKTTLARIRAAKAIATSKENGLLPCVNFKRCA